jgi:hypothetical protein
MSTATPTPTTVSTGNGFGLAGLIVGIVALVGALIPIINYGSWFVAIVGLVLAIIGLNRKGRPKRAALIGTILSGLGLVLSIVLAIVYTSLFISTVEEATGVTYRGTATPEEWAAESFGTFETFTTEGSGNDTIELPDGAEAGLVTSTHDGEMNFIIAVLDADGEHTGDDAVANTVGIFSGTAAYGLRSITEPAQFEVRADGDWTITVAPLATAPLLEPSSSGTGPAVLLYSGDAARLGLSHDGASTFQVSEYIDDTLSVQLLLTRSGAIDEVTDIGSGPSLILIKADGSWIAELR